MPLTKCPKCEYEIFNVIKSTNIGIMYFEKPVIVPEKMEAVCWNAECHQKFWYDPRTGKITKRNK